MCCTEDFMSERMRMPTSFSKCELRSPHSDDPVFNAILLFFVLSLYYLTYLLIGGSVAAPTFF